MQATEQTRVASRSVTLAVAGLLSTTWVGPAAAQGAQPDPPETVELTGIARDFQEKTHEDGHPDFEQQPDRGFGLYCNNVAEIIGDDRKPVFQGGGFKVLEQWRDSSDKPICYTLFNPAAGDQAGEVGPTSNGAITSGDTFAEWYQDVPGVNMSLPLTISMIRQEDGSYVFDDQLDPQYSWLGGFFPLDGQCFGNSGGAPDHNFHFTFELHAKFIYDASVNNYFQFIGDDDVFVFIDDKLVIDLGGVHAQTEQYVDLTRLDLVDGEEYRLDFFFAERHRTQSNFRINTSLLLQTVNVPSVSAAFD